ncbi:hypothetical protein Moror_7528 [Moniliophthora roreri MCA 2997]|uniref:Uncharacterized protein n=2 Tax=Moniliophthora roreri TaxID=221103 RepID=V2WAW2_MONRO|nr:hypothetical protein Moror_7528 [Moniliophthora roreri MCA 2997]
MTPLHNTPTLEQPKAWPQTAIMIPPFDCQLHARNQADQARDLSLGLSLILPTPCNTQANHLPPTMNQALDLEDLDIREQLATKNLTQINTSLDRLQAQNQQDQRDVMRISRELEQIAEEGREAIEIEPAMRHATLEEVSKDENVEEEPKILQINLNHLQQLHNRKLKGKGKAPVNNITSDDELVQTFIEDIVKMTGNDTTDNNTLLLLPNLVTQPPLTPA